MGSLRNPVGPLPSSIYWRRRAVLLSVIALLALLVTWIVTSGGGGDNNGAKGADGKNPTTSITPGPSGSGPAISQNPGGREESGGGDSGGSGAGSGDSGASDGTSGDGASGSGSGGSDDSSNGGGGSSNTLPAGSTLPNCRASVVTLTVSSAQNSYAPDETPAFRLTAKNSSSSDCKMDLGSHNTVLTITQTGNDGPYWASDDCPKTGSRFYRVPAGGTATHTVTWNREPSAPECATPAAGPAAAGTYLVEVKAPGFEKEQTSFVLSSD